MLKSFLVTQQAVCVIFRDTGFIILMLELEVIINDTECFIDVGSVFFLFLDRALSNM
jgi:hypothetical protein